MQTTRCDRDPMYCRHCGYSLLHLTKPRCPECGEAFDPEGPTTFGPAKGPRRPYWRRATLYLLPLLMTAGCCNATEHGDFARTLRYTAVQCTGPFSLQTHSAPALALLVFFAVIWLGWLALVTYSPIGRAPIWLHLTMGFAWCITGSAIRLIAFVAGGGC
jgi:hypothetical protein